MFNPAVQTNKKIQGTAARVNGLVQVLLADFQTTLWTDNRLYQIQSKTQSSLLGLRVPFQVFHKKKKKKNPPGKGSGSGLFVPKQIPQIPE